MVGEQEAANLGVPGAKILTLEAVPGMGSLSLVIVTNISTAVVAIEGPAPTDADPDLSYDGRPVVYNGELKRSIVLSLSEAVQL